MQFVLHHSLLRKQNSKVCLFFEQTRNPVMTKIKAVLIDDESASLKTLQLLLNKYCPQVEVKAAFTDPKKALKDLLKQQPALIFLDIEMPGLNGFELLEKLKEYRGGVIFVTAHSTYALRAFKFSAVDYLLKPVSPEDLKRAVEKYAQTQKGKPDTEMLKQLAQNIELLAQPLPRKLAISTSEGMEIITLNEVDYLKADRNYTLIRRSGKKDIMVSKPLKDFDETLSTGSFIRIHASYLINIDKVVRYVRADGGYAVMNDNTEITVSRSRKDEFLSRLKM